MHSETKRRGIVRHVQPSPLSESCAKDAPLYSKRKGANLLAYANTKPPLQKGGWGIGNTRIAAKPPLQANISPNRRDTFLGLANKQQKTKKPTLKRIGLKRRLPTLPRENRSTIGVSELNFSVRNGKRWNLTAITT